MTLRIWNTEITISTRHVKRRRNRRYVQYAWHLSGRAIALVATASAALAWWVL